MEAWCQSCDPVKTTLGWTSGNNNIDKFIKEFQLKATKYEDVVEWIPFNRLSNLRKIGDSKLLAKWLDGIRKVKNNTQSRTLSYTVKLEKLDDSQTDVLDLIKKVKNYMQSNNYKVYGITQGTKTNQYMISCDPFKTTHGWTSGNNNIDKCIKEHQLITTEYENVVEWIPFNRLSNLRKIGDSKLLAKWLDGIRKVKNNTQSRTLSYTVELEKFDDSQTDVLDLIKKFNTYIQSNNYKVYGITQDTKTKKYMIVFEDFVYKRCSEYEKCAQCERYNTSEAWCQSCDPFKTTQGWTSGNYNIDECIKKYQLNATKYENVIEWIPFNRLSNLSKIGDSKLLAKWLDGIRKVKNNTQSRILSYTVELEKFDDSQTDVLDLIKKFNNYIQSNNYKVYGITQDTKTKKYMIVFEDFVYKRCSEYEKCAQCERYNTSEAWCQSCDPFKATQGWTSGNDNIDECIKKYQLKATKYENVIEWIPFNRLSNLRKIGDSKLLAKWLDGIRKVDEYNENSRILSYTVELEKFDDSQLDESGLIKKNYKVYGITQDTKTEKYMIVFEDFGYERCSEYEKCAQCERYNTSKAWCQSCDPYKTTQGWTSGKNNIDDFIKNFQLKTTKYENVIEWIPFDRLSNLRKIGDSKLLAKWLDGIRMVDEYNEKSRILSYTVELENFDDSQVDTLELMKKFKSYMQSDNYKIYGITQDTKTSQYMIAFDSFSSTRYHFYEKCAECDRYNTSEAWCQSCDPYKTTQGWTNGNNNIDECIKEYQLKATKYEDIIEWIPFNRLSNLRKIGDSKLRAEWLDGIRKVENVTQSRTLSCPVELEKFDDSQMGTSELLKKLDNYMQSNNYKIYGLTQDTKTSQYMIVFDSFESIRYWFYGNCAQCERYNTSKAWCQSCDPFKATQGWTSGNNNIDECIKEYQLKATKYENVIEWIPFNKLSNLRKIGYSILQAEWLDGIRKVENVTQSRTSSHTVELEIIISDSQMNTLGLIKKLGNYTRPYGITQDTTTSKYMIVIDKFSYTRDNKYGICALCNRYNTSEAWCQSCDPVKTTQGWTSGNNNIDKFIKEFQLKTTKYENVVEWIPFNRLFNLRKIEDSKLRAEWLDGIRKVENDTQLRKSSYTVELKKFGDSQMNTFKFIKKLDNYMESYDYKIYGVTQDTKTSQYMIVFEDFFGKRRREYGKCAQCERYNTSEAWCRSCDSLKTTQGWTSGNKEIDNSIKEFQLKVTKYENMIEWIPFDRLCNVQTIDDSVLTAIWLDGMRKLRNKEKSRETCTVILNEFLSFKKFKSYMCQNKIYGISYYPKINQYMIVSEVSSEKYENCLLCNQCKISKSWCGSCNPNIINKGLLNGFCIGEFKLESIEYKNLIEWIPCDKLVRMQNIGEKYLEFSTTWSDVKRDYPEILKEYCMVLLKVLPDHQLYSIEFLKESYIKLDKNRINICERRQTTNTSKYMIEFEIRESSINEPVLKRDFNYGQCTNCKRYNTSRAWCQSCDPWKTIRGWTSGNMDINNCIKKFQFEATEYDKVTEWIPFNRLNDVKEVGRGGFGCVYSATWLDGKRRILYENGKCKSV
ncbi:17644_t:CDS:10 [Acaulospora morrowiae]|uniref:17644_t:CDS:1 n=1 Tax=Acaulospora morrowiae TaxID=94023 RepID=A0A9N8V5C1_9GLOM|nr:17644_t:CDS:10 [Acaulospora morrowiae]